jgi:hypothetical protein
VWNTKPVPWTGIETLLPDRPVRIPVSAMRQPSVCSQTWTVQVRRMVMNSAVAEDCHISKDSAEKLTALSAPAPSERLHNIPTLHATSWIYQSLFSNFGRSLDATNSHIQITHNVRRVSVHRLVLHKWNGHQNLCPIREIPGSNMQPETSYTNYEFFSVFLVKPKGYLKFHYRDISLNN